MMMKGCGESGASWNSPTRRKTLCYEMAEEFVQLYQGYTEKRPVARKKMQSNELIGVNVKRLRLQFNMSTASLAASSGLREGWVSRMEQGLENCTVDQLEKLARALKVETAAFFVPPPNKDEVVEGKARSRR